MEQVLAMKDVHLPFLMCMELCTAKSPGKIIGYQDRTPDAFGQGQSQSINGLYVEGVSLTHGRNPRKHIWTFAAALHEIGNVLPALLYPCTNRNVTASATPPPCFVGNDNFCDTGSTEQAHTIFYGDDPLWDGAGCGLLNDCCDFINPPWFLKRLPFPTADDTETRFCHSVADFEDTPGEVLEIYIQRLEYSSLSMSYTRVIEHANNIMYCLL